MSEIQHETPLDLSEYHTPEEAARALYEYLKDVYDDPGSLHLWSPEEAGPKRRGTAAWTVSWEGGPYEWAIWLLGGESLAYGEFGDKLEKATPEVVGWNENDDWKAEPYFKFDIQFFDNGA